MNQHSYTYSRAHTLIVLFVVPLNFGWNPLAWPFPVARRLSPLSLSTPPPMPKAEKKPQKKRRRKDKESDDFTAKSAKRNRKRTKKSADDGLRLQEEEKRRKSPPESGITEKSVKKKKRRQEVIVNEIVPIVIQLSDEMGGAEEPKAGRISRKEGEIATHDGAASIAPVSGPRPIVVEGTSKSPLEDMEASRRPPWWRRICPCLPSSSSDLQGESQRHLKANDRQFNSRFKYADNYIKTSKYNMITFIPQNLFEQFQRIANFYFLVLMILQFIPQISSISWYSTAIPLFIVLAFSAVKDGYDDVQRHISDRNVNGRKSYVVRNGHLNEEDWSNVKVGDVIRMMSNQFVAADLLLISTSEPHGICYIETMELDGETNLKTRAAMGDTAEMGDDLDAISRFEGEIVCEAPNNKLDKFNGKMLWQGKEHAITNDNILLRGCILKNTRWCYGVVVFAGRDTKLMMNSGKAKFKRTSLDRFLNILIMGIVLFLIAMCLICTILCGVWEWTTGREFTIYLPWDSSVVPNPGNKGSQQISVIAFLMFFSYIILLNTVVPISLYVSVEIIRFIHSMWINYDQHMFYDNGEKSVPARAHTTTLNEELGQVQYVFSDKTGTLTRNIMTFNKCTINGVSYGDIYDVQGNPIEVNDRSVGLDFSWNPQYETNFKFHDQNLLDAVRRGDPEVTEFWRLLALCHTVMPERDKNGNLLYQAQSPDEAALTSAARNFGFVFRSRTPQSITIEVMGNEEVYELLCILDFNNERKRMSVITRNSQGHIRLYCKGADMMIMQRLKPSTSQILKTSTDGHLADFANIGLRTLCLAYKDIDSAYFEDWIRRQQAAAVDMYNREKKLDDIYEEMEKDMTLIGATAIEDKLQDGVPETIARLAEANIKIWVLTGDKTETAINIAYSCRLLTDDMREIVVIDGQNEHEVEVQLKATRNRFEAIMNTPTRVTNKPRVEIQTIHEDAEVQNFATYESSTPTESDGEGGVALVINGDSLAFALGEKLERTYLEIATMCQAVICCRVTPLQKAQVVDLVKRNKKAVTLSIGDGANDVSMIKTAHIGVGISGQEGMQAVLASDYSIGQFKYLERLLLVHGRWSYFRMSKFLRYFFYKNFAFTLTHFWYSFFCGYSAQTVFDAVLIACYNLFFTALPVLAMGSLDQDVDDTYSLRYPKLYLPGQFNLFFNMRIFIYSVLHGIFSSLVIFFIPYGALYNGADHSGRDLDDYATLAYTTFTALIVVVTGQIAFDTYYWTSISHFVIWGSLVFYFLLAFLIYEGLPSSLVAKTSSTVSYGVAFKTMATPQFWFSILMVSVILLLPVMLNRFFWLDTHPSFADRLRVRKKLGKKVTSAREVKKPAFQRAAGTRRSARGSLRSGYAFSHTQGFGELILKGKLFKNVEQMRKEGNPSTADEKVRMISKVPEDQYESTPSSSGVPIMTLPVEPPPARSVQPHNLTVNAENNWSVRGRPSPCQGISISGDGRPFETEDSEEEDVIIERF